MNFIVRIDHLNDEQLSFFGWILVDKGEDFSTYWSPRYNEEQPVSNFPPRYLIVDDWNDAQYMVGGASITKGPQRH
jgi:hypothetical protein